jgi:hypothetical protein
MGPFPHEGDEDSDRINAGKQTVTELPSTSCFSSSDSFGMVRGGHINLSILGAMQWRGCERRSSACRVHTGYLSPRRDDWRSN